MKSPFGISARRRGGAVLVALTLVLSCGDDKKSGSPNGLAGVGGAGVGQGGSGQGAGGTAGGGNPFAGGASGAVGGSTGGGGAGTGDGGVPSGPAAIKFCNTLVTGTAAAPMNTTLDLTFNNMKLTSTTGTCSPAVNMPCPTVPGGNVAMVLESMGMALSAEVEPLVPGREYRIMTDIDPMTMRPVLRAFSFAATANRCASYVPSNMARVKFCNFLFMNGQAVNVELTVGTTKLTALGGTCSSATGANCGTVTADSHMVSMASGGMPVGMPAELGFESDNDYILVGMVEGGQPVVGGIIVPDEGACTRVDYKQVESFLNGGTGAGGMGMMGGMGGATGMGGSRL